MEGLPRFTDSAVFYNGPYVKPGGGLSKQVVIGRLNTSSRDLVTKVAKLLSKDGGHPGTVVTAEIVGRNFHVRTKDGRQVQVPAVLKRAMAARKREIRKLAKTSR